MQVGRRVARLREIHGESLREAAARTGISHTTIARIEKGEVTGSFQHTLRKIAEGYGVTLEFILAGHQVRRDFAFSLSKLSPDQRSRLYFAPARTRIRMGINFLLGEYPDEFTLSSLSLRLGLPDHAIKMVLNNSESEWPPGLCDAVVAGLSGMTGIAQHWFRSGSGDDEIELKPGTATGYASCLRKVAMAHIQPGVLEMAIDLLIIQQQTQARAASNL